MLEDSAFQWCDYAPPHGMFNMKKFEVKTLQTIMVHQFC